MKVALDTSRVKTALKYLKLYAGKSKKSVTNAYAGVELVIKDKVLTFIAFNGDNGLKYTYGHIDGDNKAVTIDFDLFANLVVNLETDAFSLIFEEERIRLTSGKSKYSLKYINSTYQTVFDIVPSDITQQNPYLTIDVQSVVNMYKGISPYLSTDVNASFLTGIFYDGNFVANNNASMGIYKHADSSETTVLAPRHTYEMIANFPNKERDIKFYLHKDVLYYTSEHLEGNIEAFTRSLFGTFPKYQTVTAKTAKHTLIAKVNTAALERACARLAPFTEIMDNQRVIMRIDKDVLTLSSTTAENDREGVEELKLETTNTEVAEYIFNLKIIMTVVHTATLDDIEIHVTPGVSNVPALFRVTDKIDTYCMPLRSKVIQA